MSFSNEQVKAKKQEIIKRIREIESILGSPQSYRMPKGVDLVAAHPEYLKELKEEGEGLVKEYQSLPLEEVEVATLTMKTIVQLTDGNFTLKYRPEYERWDFYSGQEYRKSKVELVDGYPSRILVETCNSDTYGEPLNYVYKIKIAPTEKIIEKVTPKPCSKIEEGLAMVKTQDDAFFKGMGLVKDSVTGIWRHPTTAEYDEVLKKQQKKPANTKKDGKTHFGGRFHFKGKKQ